MNVPLYYSHCSIVRMTTDMYVLLSPLTVVRKEIGFSNRARLGPLLEWVQAWYRTHNQENDFFIWEEKQTLHYHRRRTRSNILHLPFFFITECEEIWTHFQFRHVPASRWENIAPYLSNVDSGSGQISTLHRHTTLLVILCLSVCFFLSVLFYLGDLNLLCRSFTFSLD